MGPKRRPEPQQRCFAHHPLSVRSAREFVTDALRRWGVTDRLDDVRLCASELVTNAVVHGQPVDRGIPVRLTVTNGILRLEVHDIGPGCPRPRTVTQQDTTGRGLVLVAAVSDDWGTELTEFVKVVWAEFKIGELVELGSGDI